MSHQEKQRALRLFEELTKRHPSQSSNVLYKSLCEFVTTVVQDDICITKKSHGNRFRDLLCDFSLAYVPIPIQEQMMVHAQLVNGMKQVGEGSNGRIFQSGSFQGNPIVTKTKKKITDHSIYEIYVNFVILNSMLLDQQFENHIIPTYGLFLCPTNSDGTEICKPMHKQEHLFLVQHQINGKTLAETLQSGMTLDRFKTIVHELFHVLQSFEKSPYQLYHTDLHCSNIIMTAGSDGKEHPTLLDFELCSFSINKHRFRLNSLEHNYCKKDHILSGAHDFILLFSNALAYKNNEIQAYTLSILENVCSSFWVAPNQPLLISKSFFSERKEHRWIFSILFEKEEVLAMEEDKHIVHQHNLAILNKMTYEWLSNQYSL